MKEVCVGRGGGEGSEGGEVEKGQGIEVAGKVEEEEEEEV